MKKGFRTFAAAVLAAEAIMGGVSTATHTQPVKEVRQKETEITPTTRKKHSMPDAPTVERWTKPMPPKNQRQRRKLFRQTGNKKYK